MLSPIIIIGIVRLSGSRGLTFGSSLVSVIIHSQASRGQDSELTVPEMAWTAGAVAKCCNECAFGTVKCVEMDVLMMMCAGPGLVFVVYPAAIARMPGSPVWAALFFVFLFTVGVDSQVRYSTTLTTCIHRRATLAGFCCSCTFCHFRHYFILFTTIYCHASLNVSWRAP